jgi:CRP-like cAMP-binding protein
MTQIPVDSYLDFFKHVSLFHGLNEAQIKKIMVLMTISENKKGEMITREGEKGDTMFILLKGEVEISKSLVLAPLSDELAVKEKALIRLSEKQHAFFGEMALFLENPERSASIRVIQSCTLAVIQKKELLMVLDKDPLIGSVIYKNIAIELTNRLIKSNRDILKLTTAFSLALEGE